jgi:hypothetical protein
MMPDDHRKTSMDFLAELLRNVLRAIGIIIFKVWGIMKG